MDLRYWHVVSTSCLVVLNYVFNFSCLCCVVSLFLMFCVFFRFFFLFCLLVFCFFFFFFQAEDGIRDRDVTGVQTCALPICCVGRVRAYTAHQQIRWPRPLAGGGQRALLGRWAGDGTIRWSDKLRRRIPDRKSVV